MQSRIMSLVEVATSSLIGFVVSIFANCAVLPLFGFQVKLSESFTITLIFMVISIVRSYLVRRFFHAYVKRFAVWGHAVVGNFLDHPTDLVRRNSPSLGIHLRTRRGCASIPKAGGGAMRKVSIVALGVLMLTGCASSRQEVATRLGQQYVGQNVDALVVRFGPPANTFKLNSGETSYVQLGNQTNINTYRGSGSAQHYVLQGQRHCFASQDCDPASLRG